MKRNEAFPGKFFKATDFDAKGQLFTVKSVEREKVNEEEEKLVAHFLEDPRGLVISSTKFDAFSELGYGLDSDDWVGKTVVLFQGKVAFQGKIVPSIAIRAPRTGIKQIEIKQMAEADDGFDDMVDDF